jgi:hypothetical protein
MLPALTVCASECQPLAPSVGPLSAGVCAAAHCEVQLFISHVRRAAPPSVQGVSIFDAHPSMQALSRHRHDA